MNLVNHSKPTEIFNLGHTEIMSVNKLALIVCNYLKLKNTEFIYTGTTRGWIGDSPLVHLDISKAKKYGWVPEVPIQDGNNKYPEIPNIK